MTETRYSKSTIAVAMVRESSGKFFTTPEAIAEECSDMAKWSQESFQVITLDTKNGMIDRQMITLGLLDASLIHAREIFRSAIVDNAAAIILVHNHPSGDFAPSAEDIKVTRQMIEAGNILGIKVLDHVIVSSKGHMSMRESGIVSF